MIAAMQDARSDETLRHLARITAAIGPADWTDLNAAVGHARSAGVERSDLEETLLQATLFFGFPRIVSAFEELGRAWPAPAHEADPGPVPEAERRQRGRDLFARIYDHNDKSVRQMLRGFHPEFCDFVLEAAYGRVLARPGLDPRTRELLAVTALAVLRQRPQLVAHARGAARFGADRNAIEDAMRAAGLSDEEVADQTRRALGSDGPRR
jgi:4-carboxymuconolactone decarboxylase